MTHPGEGDQLFETVRTIDRARLIRYAGASGDFNPIHWNERFAREVGLDGVIAHGMLTMGMAGAALSDHLGDPGVVETYGVRFTRPVPVPDPGQVEVHISAVVGKVEEARYRVDLTVSVGGRNVLGKAQAWVRV
ncbi:MAG TPA: MaoC/PaaZ C-terminal domain-containing protein [Beutenbergiaceae bacterium]|nr:MaoC/PaaZ C-terminal domain-containing protein [Beutenbergiaceae bacterium]